MPRRPAALLALLAVAEAGQCSFSVHGELCPDAGMACNQNMLCLAGQACIASSLGLNSWDGSCGLTPQLTDVYGTSCNLAGSSLPCAFSNPLALTPQTPPAALQCARSPGNTLGQCRLQPNNHGDACNVDAECASNHCLKEVRLCKGIDEGEACTPGLYPDTCGSAHFCAPTPDTLSGGICQKSVSPGFLCPTSTSCTMGYFCTSTNGNAPRCIAPLSVPVGLNTTTGPYMCASGNAIMVVQAPTTVDSTYTCIIANATTLSGTACNSNDNSTVPPGYVCNCASDGTEKLRTAGWLGLGARSAVWNSLYTCLIGATNVMGDRCEFDSSDMERVRYGSCVYYACYPYYLQLVNATGGRFFRDPFSQFQPFAQCEINSAKQYYTNVYNTPCIAIQNMENWKCTTLAGPTSLSIASTTAVICFVFLFNLAAYLAHAWYFRAANKSKLQPFQKK